MEIWIFVVAVVVALTGFCGELLGLMTIEAPGSSSPSTKLTSNTKGFDVFGLFVFGDLKVLELFVYTVVVPALV